jgi:hypothetical protein
MKTKIKILSFFLVFAVFFYSFTSLNNIKQLNKGGERVSFRIKGTGSKDIFVRIGIGSSVGSGACCSGVSNNSTVSFTGEVGDLVYDSDRKRIITKIYKELEGTTIDLYDYY